MRTGGKTRACPLRTKSLSGGIRTPKRLQKPRPQDGRRLERDALGQTGLLQMTEDISRGSVGQILIKDMSRLGRDHLRVGLFLEQLREMNVRLIAVAEGIDTAKGEDDFMPFRNILAEWHARDTSRKIRAIFGARTAAGNHVTGALPYGYLHDPKDRQKWIVDEEAAPVVKRIFRSVIAGKNIAKSRRN